MVKKRRRRSWRVPGLLAIGLVVALAWAVWLKGGADQLYSKARKRQEVIERIQELEARNDRLRREIRLLEEDPRYLELMVRKEFNVVRDDEVRVLFPEPVSGNTPSSAGEPVGQKGMNQPGFQSDPERVESGQAECPSGAAQ